MTAIRRPVVSFAAITEEQIGAARGAKSDDDDIAWRDAGVARIARFAAIKSRWTRGGGGGCPGGVIVSHGSQFGSFSPDASASNGPSNHSRASGNCRVKFRGHLGADFVAAAADARAERGDHVFRARAKFHLHAAERFFGDARERAAPAGMNRGDGALLRIGEKNRNAVGGLDGKQDAGLAGEQRVAFRRFRLAVHACGALPRGRYRNGFGAA